MARAMKDSGIAWIGEIPEEWSIIKNKYLLARVYSGGTPTASDERFYSDVGTPFVSIADMSSTDYVFSTKKCVSADGIKDKGLEILPKGTVLYSIYATIGAVSELAIDATINQAILALILKPGFDKRYYKYCLSAMRDYIYFNANGNTQFNLNADKVWNYVFVRPPYAIQKEIANSLDAECARIDAVIEQTRASIEEYKKLKQAVITQAVTKGIRPNRPMKDSGIEWISHIPENWNVLRGKWLFHETDERSEDGNEELLTVSHITGITPRSQKNVNMFMSESLVGYKICRVNDIAANTMWMWQGAIGVSKYHGVISPSYNTYRQTNNQYNPDYLDYLLRIRPLVDTYNANSTGITASRLRLYPDRFLSIMFPIPPLKEQIEIATYLNEKIGDVERLIEKKERYLTELEKYRKSLIFEYVTGKKEA